MDSLTQLTLGAAVGEAVLGRRVGYRAAAWGAVLGTLPDLDVFVPMGDAVRDFTYHRSFSHSLFVLALLTPLIVWLILKIHPYTREYRRQWAVLVYGVFATHVLLDAFTVYGTQIFWPVVTTPQSWSVIFIIDPVYTVPLLLGVLCALVLSRERAWGHRLNMAGLAFSTLYLAWAVGAKLYVTEHVTASLARQGVTYERLLTTPAPFNTVLWRVVLRRDGEYLEGYYSLFDGDDEVAFRRYASRDDLLAGVDDHWPVRRLQWFTHGFYAVSELDGRVIVTDLRMGLEPDYVFRFAVAETGNPHAEPITPFLLPGRARLTEDGLEWLWHRMRGATREGPNGP